MIHTPGPGDEATWGACTGHPGDPRTPQPDDEGEFDFERMSDDEMISTITELADTRDGLLAALERLTASFLNGSHYETVNPYCRPEVRASLIAIAKAQGKSTFGNDWMNAIDMRRFPTPGV